MGREKRGKRKRCSSHRRSPGSDSSEEDESSSESSAEDTSTDSSSSESEDEGRHRSKRTKSGGHKRRHRRSSKHKKEHKTKKLKKGESISTDDYFSKSSEFRAWLSKERGVFFSDLTSEESRKLFKKFVNKWNSGLLKKKYYQGIQSSSLEHKSQTQYKWKFASGIDDKQLSSMRESVSSWTASTDEAPSRESDSRPTIGPSSRPVIGPSSRPPIGPAQGPSRPAVDPFAREERREVDAAQVRRGRKELRKHHELVLDELLPKATGRAAMIEKKKARAEGRREREVSPGVRDSVLMGSSGDIKDRVRARQEQRHHRAQAAQQKISDYQAKEKAKMEAFLQMAKANRKEGALW